MIKVTLTSDFEGRMIVTAGSPLRFNFPTRKKRVYVLFMFNEIRQSMSLNHYPKPALHNSPELEECFPAVWTSRQSNMRIDLEKKNKEKGPHIHDFDKNTGKLRFIQFEWIIRNEESALGRCYILLEYRCP